VREERCHRKAHVLRLSPSDAPRRGVVAALGLATLPRTGATARRMI
jgi:hypothetical protein